MKRTVQPEILDRLRPEDPAARANRRDLILYNRLMGNFRWLALQLGKLPERGGILEFGAGDGGFGRHLLRKQHLRPTDPYTGVDRLLGRPTGWPAEWKWIQADLRGTPIGPESHILVCNLIMHQFRDSELEKLGERIKTSSLRHLLISEPARRRFPELLVAWSRLLGVHPVTLHDARISVQAGFRGTELAALLGLDSKSWRISASESFLGGCRIVCSRK